MKLDMVKHSNYLLEQLEKLYEDKTIEVSGDVTLQVPSTFRFCRNKKYEDGKIYVVIYFNRQKLELFETKEEVQKRIPEWFAELPKEISA